MSTTVTLNEFLNRDGDHINQVVYKVDGNFNGNITGDNVTVILMGDGDINGDINARDGEVVLIKGNINGNIKANRVLCPSVSNVDKPSTKYMSGACFNCTHVRFGSDVGLMFCDVTNKWDYRLTPCENYERRYR